MTPDIFTVGDFVPMFMIGFGMAGTLFYTVACWHQVAKALQSV